MEKSLYSVEDFMADESFQRYVWASNGIQTEDASVATAFWQDWLAKHPHKQAEANEAAHLIIKLQKIQTATSDFDVDSAWENIANQLQKPQVIAMRRFTWRWAAAATLLFAFSAALYYTYFFNPVVTHQTVKSSEHLTLPDGTKVVLYNGARLQFPDAFTGDVREVMLEGNAFFNVAHQPSKPFYVKTDKLIIKVLGTSFFVRNTSDKNTEIAVKTGRVAVAERYSDKKNNGVLLTPNQKAVYYAEQGHFVTALVEKPTPAVAPEKLPSFVYNESALKNVISDLQAAYQVQITLENDALANCNLTGNLSQMDMFAQLDAVTQAIGASYQVKGTVILISGKGCN